MQEFPEGTQWINTSVDLGRQFFPQKLNIATAVMFWEAQNSILDMKEGFQNFQSYINDVAEPK